MTQDELKYAFFQLESLSLIASLHFAINVVLY